MSVKIHVLTKHICLNSTYIFSNATEDRPVVNFPHQLNPLLKYMQMTSANKILWPSLIYTIYFRVALMELYIFHIYTEYI